MGSFYPRSPCGERPPRGGFCYLDNIVSIHALLAESDDARRFQSFCQSGFLSTLSLRRATHWQTGQSRTRRFYPRSPCGERPILGNPCAGCPAVSIHALLAESDRLSMSAAPLARRVSIHALLAESDARLGVAAHTS